MIPNNIDEAIEELVKLKISPDLIDDRALRNNWKLWGESNLVYYFYAIDIYHPDDMSSIIIDCYKKHLLGEVIEMDKIVDHYHRFWKKSYGDNHLEVMRSNFSEKVAKIREIKINNIITPEM